MRVAIIGDLGSGKTLFLSYIGYKLYIEGWEIYSNYNVQFPHRRITEPEEISDIEDGFFMADELWSWIDARLSMTKKNRLLSSILLKSRKHGYGFGYTSQSITQMDLRIRHIITHVMLPNVQNHTVCIVEGYKRDKLDWLYMKKTKLVVAEVGKLYDTNKGLYCETEKGEVIKRE